MLTLHEWHTEHAGQPSRETVEIGVEEGALVVLVSGEAPVALPIQVIERVMERYGKPLAEGVELDGPRLDLGNGGVLHLIRHLARFDVIARDFVVWSAPGREPLAELAIAVSGALAHLAKAVRTTA